MSGVGAMFFYVATDLDKLEYKYILAATILVAPLAASGMERLLRRWPLGQWGLALTTVLALGMMHQWLLLHVGAQIPANLVHAPLINEESFWLSLAPGASDADWTSAIRTQTPPDTVVVTQPSPLHLSAFLARALYVPSDVDGEQSSGYSVNNRFNLLTWRGYSAQLYDQRLAIVQSLYSSTSPAALQAAITAFAALQRPVAIQLAPNTFLLQWLQAQGVGRALFTGATQVVWFLPATTLSSEVRHVSP